MEYYTERNGLRKQQEKTYVIDPKRYALLLDCCERYYLNIAWEYPEECPDGRGCCGIDKYKLADDMEFEIPTLLKNKDGLIASPVVHKNVFDENSEIDEYDQYALLDFIEFLSHNMSDYDQRDYHSFFSHYHYYYRKTNEVFWNFHKDINAVFDRTRLLYKLTENGIVERVVENDVVTDDLVNTVLAVPEDETRKLLDEAITKYRSPGENSSRDAVEKLWDAFERLKTYYSIMDKKTSANTIIQDMSNGNLSFQSLFEDEFKELTKIGNTFRIRHHETDKTDITDNRYYDYFFGRCLSMIALAVNYLK